MNLPRLKDYSIGELEEMAKAIKMEMDAREAERFKILCSEACNALNALRMEFPLVSFTVECGCDACGEDVEFNLFDVVDNFTARHFTR